MTDSDHDPIEAEHRERMNVLAQTLDDYLNQGRPCSENGHRGKGDVGFVLLVFEFGNEEGRTNYISTAKAEDVIEMLKGQIAHLERRARHTQ